MAPCNGRLQLRLSGRLETFERNRDDRHSGCESTFLHTTTGHCSTDARTGTLAAVEDGVEVGGSRLRHRVPRQKGSLRRSVATAACSGQKAVLKVAYRRLIAGESEVGLVVVQRVAHVERRLDMRLEIFDISSFENRL